ncbi:hypothetical protein CPB83DRAFT_932934 [Crepidotus variabilis]|uniref:Uncharacterized protein n=1 Tax=Crepidotus variabilis TaxID=179855 RepID=A0A9P6JPY8_9AGAR|nr:hypothetical protein CPB83DRAFT_932934 [Crepidotus variabilis]
MSSSFKFKPILNYPSIRLNTRHYSLFSHRYTLNIRYGYSRVVQMPSPPQLLDSVLVDYSIANSQYDAFASTASCTWSIIPAGCWMLDGRSMCKVFKPRRVDASKRPPCVQAVRADSSGSSGSRRPEAEGRRSEEGAEGIHLPSQFTVHSSEFRVLVIVVLVRILRHPSSVGTLSVVYDTHTMLDVEQLGSVLGQGPGRDEMGRDGAIGIFSDIEALQVEGRSLYTSDFNTSDTINTSDVRPQMRFLSA